MPLNAFLMFLGSKIPKSLLICLKKHLNAFKLSINLFNCLVVFFSLPFSCFVLLLKEFVCPCLPLFALEGLIEDLIVTGEWFFMCRFLSRFLSFVCF